MGGRAPTEKSQWQPSRRSEQMVFTPRRRGRSRRHFGNEQRHNRAQTQRGGNPAPKPGAREQVRGDGARQQGARGVCLFSFSRSTSALAPHVRLHGTTSEASVILSG